MTRYSFDMQGNELDRWIDLWLRQYPPEWLPKAVIEALYQGRYKAISVWQILELWRRRGKPLQHFGRDFERMISGQSFQLLFSQSPRQQTILTVPEPVLVAADRNGNCITIPDEDHANIEPMAQTQSGEEIRQNPTLFGPSRPSALILPSQAPTAGSTQLSIQPFKPPEQFKLTLPAEIDRSRLATRFSIHRAPIQQFVPAPEAADVLGKLKAIAQAPLTENSQANSGVPDATQGTTQPEASTIPSTVMEDVQPDPTHLSPEDDQFNQAES
jgi:hypothetical protein